MKTLICMHGLPRSGKSTIAAKLSKQLGAPIVSADCVRLALHGQRYQELAEPMVRAIRIIMIRSLFYAGHQVVIDDETNFSREIRDRLKSDEWRTVYYEVPTSAKVCQTRAIQTGQRDLLPVIESMEARRDPLGDDEERYEVPFDPELHARTRLGEISPEHL